MNTTKSVLAVCQKFVNLANCIEKSRNNPTWWTVETISIKAQTRVAVRRSNSIIITYEVVDGMVRNVLHADMPMMNDEEFVVLQFALLDAVENYML